VRLRKDIAAAGGGRLHGVVPNLARFGKAVSPAAAKATIAALRDR
jgi:hypothetical protein